jgi:beta-glucosidase
MEEPHNIYIYIYNFIPMEHHQNAHEFELWAMQDKQHGFIGINLFAYWLVPITNTTEDASAFRRAMDFLIGW